MKHTRTVACLFWKSAWQAVSLQSALTALLLAPPAALLLAVQLTLQSCFEESAVSGKANHLSVFEHPFSFLSGTEWWTLLFGIRIKVSPNERKRYWAHRKAPDAVKLFEGFWRWDFAPSGASHDKDAPLEVFTGYWNYKQKRHPERQY